MGLFSKWKFAFFFNSAKNWTQGPMHAKHALYHYATSPAWTPKKVEITDKQNVLHAYILI